MVILVKRKEFCIMELKYIKGLSDKRIEELNKIGIDSAEKLIRHFPRNYLDLSKVSPIKRCTIP